MSILLQNLLRNAAKSGCQTNYTYIPDIDMVPTPSMDLQLEQFLSTPEVHFLLTTVDLQCLPMSQGEGMRNVCLCGAHLWDCSGLTQVNIKCAIHWQFHMFVSGCLTTKQNYWHWWGRSKPDSSTRLSTQSTRSQVIWKSGKRWNKLQSLALHTSETTGPSLSVSTEALIFLTLIKQRFLNL